MCSGSVDIFAPAVNEGGLDHGLDVVLPRHQVVSDLVAHKHGWLLLSHPDEGVQLVATLNFLARFTHDVRVVITKHNVKFPIASFRLFVMSLSSIVNQLLGLVTFSSLLLKVQVYLSKLSIILSVVQVIKGHKFAFIL